MELVNLLTKIERTTLHRGSDGTNVALCDGLGRVNMHVTYPE